MVGGLYRRRLKNRWSRLKNSIMVCGWGAVEIIVPQTPSSPLSPSPPPPWVYYIYPLRGLIYNNLRGRRIFCKIYISSIWGSGRKQGVWPECNPECNFLHSGIWKTDFIALKPVETLGFGQNATRMQTFAFWNCFWRIYSRRASENKGFCQNATVAFWNLEVSVWSIWCGNHRKTQDDRQNRGLSWGVFGPLLRMVMRVDWYHKDMTMLAVSLAWRGISYYGCNVTILKRIVLNLKLSQTFC